MDFHCTLSSVKRSEFGSFFHSSRVMPCLSLSVISSVVGTISSNIFLSSGLQRDQSMFLSRGEIHASFPGLYVPVQKYSMSPSSGKSMPWAKPGGSQIHSL